MMDNLDTNAITAALLTLAKKVLSGEKIEKTIYKVDLEVPEEIATAIRITGTQLGYSPETMPELFSQLANEGLNFRLKQMIDQVKGTNLPKQQPSDVMEQLKAAGLDISGLAAGFDQLKNLTTQLEAAKQVLENDTENDTDRSPQGSDDVTETEKDPN